MDAVLSGHARVAFLLDGQRLASIHAGPDAKVVARQPYEIGHLLAGAEDLELLHGVSLGEVSRRLSVAVERIDTLHLALILLDGELSEETRRQAASDLEESLGHKHAQDFLNRIFAGHPLPAGADLAGARAASSKQVARVRQFIKDLAASQEAVTAVHLAWEGISERSFPDPGLRRELRRSWTREGLFLAMVRRLQKGRSLQVYLNRCLDKPTFRAHRAVLGEWVQRLDDLASNASVREDKPKTDTTQRRRSRVPEAAAFDLEPLLVNHSGQDVDFRISSGDAKSWVEWSRLPRGEQLPVAAPGQPSTLEIRIVLTLPLEGPLAAVEALPNLKIKCKRHSRPTQVSKPNNPQPKLGTSKPGAGAKRARGNSRRPGQSSKSRGGAAS